MSVTVQRLGVALVFSLAPIAAIAFAVAAFGAEGSDRTVCIGAAVAFVIAAPIGAALAWMMNDPVWRS